jgi:hypothetical protein
MFWGSRWARTSKEDRLESLAEKDAQGNLKGGVAFKIAEMSKQAKQLENRAKFANVRTVGSAIGKLGKPFKKLGEMLESTNIQNMEGLSSAGEEALKLVSPTDFDLKDVKDPGAKKYLSHIKSIQQKFTNFEGGEKQMKDMLKYTSLNKEAKGLIDKILADDDTDLNEGERGELMKMVATQSGGSALMSEDSLSVDTLKQLGGKERMTQKYLEAAADAAKANQAFVRAVYGEAKKGGKIQETAKELLTK